MGALEEIRSRVEADGVEFIYAMFVEMHGKPCAKLVPVGALEGLMSDGAGFAGFAAGPMGQDPSSPDILALPDPASYTQLPWQPNVAAMQCDPTVEGELWAVLAEGDPAPGARRRGRAQPGASSAASRPSTRWWCATRTAR